MCPLFTVMLSVQCFWIRITKQGSPKKKIHQEADSNANNGRHLFKAQNIPQAHAEGTKVQGSVKTAFHSHGTQSENWKRVSGLLLSVGLPGCSVLVGVVLPWEWEDDERELSLELLRVSVLVLVLFIFLLLARGALSTF